MFTVIVFPVKLENKDYPFYKSPKKVLEIEDSEAMTYTINKELVELAEEKGYRRDEEN